MQRINVIPTNPSYQGRQRIPEVLSSLIGCEDSLSHTKTVSGEGTSQENEFEESISELDSTLRDMLDTILDEAMAREIIYGAYKPKKELLMVPEVLDSIRRRTSQRFPLEVATGSFPLLAMDRQLLRYIYRNAVSNACKYGQTDGIVETFVEYDDDNQKLTMKVVNRPGEGHDELVKLRSDEVTAVFEPETRLRSTVVVTGRKAQLIQNESSGNGAWIMQKCALAMGGKCDISFEPEATVFTFSCPIPATYPSQGSEQRFCIPKNAWGVVIDDSRIQRKLMGRFLSAAGIRESNRLILGENSEEVFGFVDTVKKLMAENPEDKILLIADENLDIVDGGACHQTVSGSLIVEKLRSELSPESEERLLALIRSANDSAEDIKLYEKRSHGFLMKEPVKKDGVLGLLKPLWIERFPSSCVGNSSAHNSDSGDLDLNGPSSEDIREALRLINALSAVESETTLQRRWHPIREKLHALKGDLMSMLAKDVLVGSLQGIDELLSCSRIPHDFPVKWNAIELQVESLLK